MTAIDSLELASRGLQELESIETSVLISLTDDKFRVLKHDLEEEYDKLEWVIPFVAKTTDKVYGVILHGVSYTFHVTD